MYICTGAYTANGQKNTAPKTPMTEVKYGNVIASKVAVATYNVRKQAWKRFIWIVGNNGNLNEKDLSRNLLSGNLSRNHLSTVEKHA
ncbi:hypothetical protein CRG98_048134 [Punica granatum]|uniref:Uncharacterized protein n=1 Tax=Punica granatum TaxID=22663 RepID=A0A2I0HID7_PUNGR|nr:hypothetical protein CRG98_048134 [Punica granatum]